MFRLKNYVKRLKSLPLLLQVNRLKNDSIHNTRLLKFQEVISRYSVRSLYVRSLSTSNSRILNAKQNQLSEDIRDSDGAVTVGTKGVLYFTASFHFYFYFYNFL